MSQPPTDASWASLKDLVTSIEYYREVINQGTPHEAVRFEFDVDARTQTVLLRRQAAMTNLGGEWVIVEAPFAEIHRVDLADILTQVEKFPCGAVGRLDNMVTLRNSIDLKAAMQDASFLVDLIKTMREIANLSDAFEGHYTGNDRF